ncbi:MAG: ABC transporter ATP-binding protein, partial [Gemmatimonadaceae bacterium]
MSTGLPRSSRQRYRRFVDDYLRGRLDDSDASVGSDPPFKPVGPSLNGRLARLRGIRPRGKRREYLGVYIRWLKPLRLALGAVFLLALIRAGLEMIEPLFMRFIVDRVLLNGALTTPQRLTRLHMAGAVFLTVIVISSLINVTKDYRQRLLNVRVMLSLRRALFERLLHLPLPKLWEMKTGGILSRLTGDIETTTGLLQMAVVSPAISVIRLAISVGVLLALNWRLAVTSLLIIPAVLLLSLVFARRVKPIYRSVRKDVEQIDGRVGETFSGIRVVRAFRGEPRELQDYLRGRHTVLRKE